MPRDPTSEHEALIRRGAEDYVRWLQEIGPQILNRPIGTEPVSPEDQLADYMSVREDPEGLRKRLEALTQQYGNPRGTFQWTRWINHMESRLPKKV